MRGAVRLTRREVGSLLVCTYDSVLRIRDAPLELPNALPDGRPYLWQPLGAEEEEHHDQDHQNGDRPMAIIEVPALVTLERIDEGNLGMERHRCSIV